MSATNKGDKKRKTGVSDNDVKVGARIKSLLLDKEWYGGRVTMIRRGKGGNVVKVGILYDDGEEEECSWPDDDIVLDSDGNNEGQKDRKRKKVEGGALGMFVCGEEGCEYKAKTASTLRRHKAYIHDIDVVYHPCSKCDYEAKDAGNLKRHKANVHDIDVVYYPCSECDYEAKSANTLKQHKANVHDIDIVFYPCSKCDYEAKTAGALRRHKANIHDIDVVYFSCNVNGCEYKAKQSSQLKRHKKGIHGIS